MIIVEHASKRYVKYDDTPMLATRLMRLHQRSERSELWAVRDADFTVQGGTCLGVIGRNGSGKSTLLRMLAGVTAPTTGRVAVGGRVAPLIAVGVGFHPELTGRENVYVSGAILGLRRPDIDRRFDEIVAFAELEKFIDTPVKFYSSGMFVRLGFAVSVAVEPDVLVVDEVLAVGDLAFQLRCIERMVAIREAGATVVVVSHNMNAIRRMCDRVLVLHDGLTRHDGDAASAIATFHDLLGEQREMDGNGLDGGDVEVDRHGEVERFELLGADGAPARHVAVGEECTAELRVRFERDVAGCLVGATVLSEWGVQAYGETSDWADLHGFTAGQVATFRMRFRAQLAGGSYSLHAGVVLPSGVHLTPIPVPVQFYVDGRSRVNGIADLDGRFDVVTE